MEKNASFFSKLCQLEYWDSHNTKTTGYCKDKKQAKMTIAMLEVTKGIKQHLTIYK